MRLIEIRSRAVSRRLAGALGVGGVTGNRALTRCSTGCIRERDVVVEDDAELDDAEEHHEQDRQDEGELRHRLPSLVLDCVLQMHFRLPLRKIRGALAARRGLRCCLGGYVNSRTKLVTALAP